MAAGQILCAGIISPPQPLGTFTFGGSAAAFTLAWPAGHAIDDIGILVIETANEACATPAGWTVLNTPTGTGAAASPSSTRLSAFWRRATSAAEADASIADSGTEQQAVMFVLRGCDTGASPIEALTGNTNAASTTAQTCLSITTLGASRYVVGAAVNAGNPGATNNACCVWTTNAALGNFIELADFTLTGASQIGVFGGQMVVPGATGTTAGTFGTTGVSEHIVFAVKPIGG
jgi:hypothetical protein